MYNEIKNLYKSKGLKRRFRVVKDGLWIFPENSVHSSGMPAGIFINKINWENDKNFTLENYLPNGDDELGKVLERSNNG